MAAEANLSLFRQHAAVILAQQAAQRAVKRQIRSQGKIKLSAISAATLTRLGNDYLRSHPELLVEAAADPIVQNLRITNRRRAVDRQRELLCECQVHNAPAPEETSGLEMKEGHGGMKEGQQ
jgi:hypothetical protein